MNNLSLPERIQKYLDGAMSASETNQFETDLEKDTALQKAFVAYSINAYNPPSAQYLKSHKLVASVYDTLAPIPAPTLPVFFRVKMWFQAWPRNLVVLSALVLLIVAMFWPKPTLDVGKIIAEFAEPAKCKGVAGKVLSPRQIFEKSSGIYCGHELEPVTLQKLQQLSEGIDSFCMADYHIAHWFLLNGRYEEALTAFEVCLASRQTIEANQETKESRSAIQLNTVLAQLGKDNDAATARNKLDALEKTVKATSPVYANIQNLKAALAK